MVNHTLYLFLKLHIIHNTYTCVRAHTHIICVFIYTYLLLVLFLWGILVKTDVQGQISVKCFAYIMLMTPVICSEINMCTILASKIQEILPRNSAGLLKVHMYECIYTNTNNIPTTMAIILLKYSFLLGGRITDTDQGTVFNWQSDKKR